MSPVKKSNMTFKVIDFVELLLSASISGGMFLQM